MIDLIRANTTRSKHPLRTFLCLIITLVAMVSRLQADEDPEEAVVTSIREDRREILLYGIDTQVLETLDKIEEERDELLLDDVFVAFKITTNPRVRLAAIDVFDALEYYVPIDDVLNIITDWDIEDSDLVIRAISYVSYEKNDEIADMMLPLVDDINTSVARAAIRGIGRIGSQPHVDLLLERFEDSDFDEKLKPEIILAFGDLQNPSVVETLIEILDSPDESITWRRYACDSLGKITDLRALPAIKRALVNEDAMLRAYAVSSIRYFKDQDIAPALIEGLRDSFWRVRISAARALGELGAESSLNILGFKARKDPENNVRDEAIRAISLIGSKGSERAFEMIRAFYEDRLFPLALRITCVEVLTKLDPGGSIESFTRVIVKESTERESKLLERTAYFLSLIDIESDADGESPSISADQLESFYARFISSGNLVLMIYGIRGAERNQITSLKESVQELSEEGNHRSVRRAAIAALENL